MGRPRSTILSGPEAGIAGTGEVRLPRYRVVFETLLGDIASGRFQPGDRLPTEAELAKTFSASRSTIARAMRDLKSRGLLNRQRGGGTHIARRASTQVALFTPFAQSAAALGFIGGQIHAHLSEHASHRSDHWRLQLVGRANGDRIEQMMAAARALIEQNVAGFFYYPVDLPAETAHYNQLVIDKLI